MKFFDSILNRNRYRADRCFRTQTLDIEFVSSTSLQYVQTVFADELAIVGINVNTSTTMIFTMFFEDYTQNTAPATILSAGDWPIESVDNNGGTSLTYRRNTMRQSVIANQNFYLQFVEPIRTKYFTFNQSQAATGRITLFYVI